jgi:hypothetical protein
MLFDDPVMSDSQLDGFECISHHDAGEFIEVVKSDFNPWVFALGIYEDQESYIGAFATLEYILPKFELENPVSLYIF